MTVDAYGELLEADVVAAAAALLGATLIWGDLSARIVETEAYRGEDDPACHAFGKTAMRNMVLFGEPGLAYVYFNYGMHWMLNVSAHRSGRAAGILIRAAQPLTGQATMASRRARPGRPVTETDLLSGPGKLCQAFGVDQHQNGCPLLHPRSLEDLHLVPPTTPVVAPLATPRVGIAQGKWHDVPWRFLDPERLEWVSKRPK